MPPPAYPEVRVMQAAATGNGNGTSLNVAGDGAAVLNIVSSVAMSGGTTINFEATADGTNWVAINGHALGTGTLSTTATADGIYRFAVLGLNAVRARISGYSAGTVTVTGYAIPDTPAFMTVQAVLASGGVISTKTALTAAAPAAASVGVSSASAVAANASRKGLILVNTSSNTISVGFGQTAVLNSGLTLMPNGGSFVMDEYTYSTGAVNAIASAASSNLAVQEYS